MLGDSLRCLGRDQENLWFQWLMERPSMRIGKGGGGGGGACILESSFHLLNPSKWQCMCIADK